MSAVMPFPFVRTSMCSFDFLDLKILLLRFAERCQARSESRSFIVEIMNVRYGQNTALQILSQVTSVELQEKANLIEVATALLGHEIEMANRYRILDQDGTEIMWAVEQTGCCNRHFKTCCGDCAPTYGGASQKVFSIDSPA